MCRNNSEHDKTGEAQGFQPNTDFKLKCWHLPLTHNHLTMFTFCKICNTLSTKPQSLLKKLLLFYSINDLGSKTISRTSISHLSE